MGEMINSLIEYDVLVEMTRYPINVNYEKLFALLNSVGVRTKNFNQYEKTKILRKHILTHEAKQTDFDCCMIHWKSMQLKDGKLYLCQIQAYIDIFNKYFIDYQYNSKMC
jgi:hypothetical protein